MNQMAATRRWSPQPLALHYVESPLSGQSARVVYGDSLEERLRRKAFRLTGLGSAVPRAVNELGGELVHAHFLRDASSIAAVARRLALPLVVTVHGYDVTATKELSPRALGRFREALGSADRVVAVSGFIARRAAELGADPAKTVVAPIGVPTRSRDEGRCASTLADGAEPDVLFVGRLVRKKGCHHAISAVSGAQAALGRRLRLTVVGDGPMRDELVELARSHGVDARFLGSLPPHQVAEAMSASEVFLAPSLTGPDGDSEGFGMVFLEAALAGLPVVSYRHGGVPEAVADGVTGLLAAEGDLHELTDNLTEVLSDGSLARRLGTAGRDRVHREFDIDVCTQRLEAIYDDVAGSSSS